MMAAKTQEYTIELSTSRDGREWHHVGNGEQWLDPDSGVTYVRGPSDARKLQLVARYWVHGQTFGAWWDELLPGERFWLGTYHARVMDTGERDWHGVPRTIMAAAGAAIAIAHLGYSAQATTDAMYDLGTTVAASVFHGLEKPTERVWLAIWLRTRLHLPDALALWLAQKWPEGWT